MAPVNNGIPQGCALTPILFNLYITSLHKKVIVLLKYCIIAVGRDSVEIEALLQRQINLFARGMWSTEIANKSGKVINCYL